MGTDDASLEYDGPERRTWVGHWATRFSTDLGRLQQGFADLTQAVSKEEAARLRLANEWERELRAAHGEYSDLAGRVDKIERALEREAAERAQTLRLLRWGLAMMTFVSLLFGAILAYGRLTGQPV